MVPNDNHVLCHWWIIGRATPWLAGREFSPKSGHMGWLLFLQGSGNWLWQSPCSVFHTDIMARIPRKMNGHRVKQSSTVRRHLTGQKSLHYMCCTPVAEHKIILAPTVSPGTPQAYFGCYGLQCFTKASFHFPLKTSGVVVVHESSWEPNVLSDNEIRSIL